jgi:outer membrane protein assembly factor BamB
MKTLSTAFLLALTAAIIVGCIVSDKEYQQSRRILSLRPNFPPVELNPIGFDKHWESHLRDREIANMWLMNGNIFAETKGHWLYKINAKSGYVLWVYDVGAAIEADPYCYIYEESEKTVLMKYNELYLLASDSVHCVDEEAGFRVWTHGLRKTPSSPVFASASHFYYGSWNDRLYAVDKETKVVTWEYVTGNDIVAGGTEKDPTIFFASEDGKVYCADASRGSIAWSFEGQGAFSATPYFYKNRLYVGSRDYNIYAIRTTDGTLDWRFPCQAEVVATPVAVDNVVYCCARNNWFYAIDRKTGEELWRLRDGTKLLLVGRKNAYVLTKPDREIACLDNESGKLQWKKPFSDVDFFVTNDADLRLMKKGDSDYLIYFGYKNAWFFSIREKDLY